MADEARNIEVLGLEIGSAVFIRGIHLHHIGRVFCVTSEVIGLEQASWVAIESPFCEFLAGDPAAIESERFPGRVYLPRDKVHEWSPWEHGLT